MGTSMASSIQNSINLGKTFLRISRIRNIPLTWNLARVFAYIPPFISQILGFIYWTVLILILIYFEWRDIENQQLIVNWILIHWIDLSYTCQLFLRYKRDSNTSKRTCMLTILLVFSVTPFKIDQNQNQNRSIDKVQNQGSEHERRYIYKDPR